MEIFFLVWLLEVEAYFSSEGEGCAERLPKSVSIRWPDCLFSWRKSPSGVEEMLNQWLLRT